MVAAWQPGAPGTGHCSHSHPASTGQHPLRTLQAPHISAAVTLTPAAPADLPAASASAAAAAMALGLSQLLATSSSVKASLSSSLSAAPLLPAPLYSSSSSLWFTCRGGGRAQGYRQAERRARGGQQYAQVSQSLMTLGCMDHELLTHPAETDRPSSSKHLSDEWFTRSTSTAGALVLLHGTAQGPQAVQHRL